MEFFPAIPVDLPHIPEGIGAPVVSAGPYYVKEWTKGRTLPRQCATRTGTTPRSRGSRSAARRTSIRSSGRSVPLDATQRRIDKNETDFGGIPPARLQGSSSKYGINKSPFFVRKNLVFWYLAMNTTRRCSRATPSCARPSATRSTARRWSASTASSAGGRTDQILPPGMPGYKDWAIYPLKAASTPRAREGQVARAGQHPRRQGRASTPSTRSGRRSPRSSSST